MIPNSLLAKSHAPLCLCFSTENEMSNALLLYGSPAPSPEAASDVRNFRT